MSFEVTLQRFFPGALEERRFVEQSQAALRPLGFEQDNSIACVACCRDEISQTLLEHATRSWGLVFNKSSLAGMVTSGVTGFSAALAHAPQNTPREKYVFYAMPHVAIGSAGELGVVERPGRPELSTACGALLALLQELEQGNLDTGFRSDDVEQSLLKARVAARLSENRKPDLLELTHLAHEIILEDLERTIDLAVDTDRADYAVFTGIQIHGRPGVNFVQPRVTYAVLSGERQEIACQEQAA